MKNIFNNKEIKQNIDPQKQKKEYEENVILD